MKIFACVESLAETKLLGHPVNHQPKWQLVDRAEREQRNEANPLVISETKLIINNYLLNLFGNRGFNATQWFESFKL